MSKEKQTISSTLLGEDIVKFFIAGPLKTDPGFIIGLREPGLSDIHLTVVIKDNRIETHISDRTNGITHRIYSKPIEFDEIARVFIRRVRTWERSIHGNQLAFLPVGDLRSELHALMKTQGTIKKDDGTIVYPLELTEAELLMDFENPDRWTTSRVSRLDAESDIFSIIIENAIIRMVFPSGEKGMYLCPSFRQLDNLVEYMLDTIGFDQYLEELTQRTEFAALIQLRVEDVLGNGNGI